jgi:WhiB family redox-sensing transcriptional regulator
MAEAMTGALPLPPGQWTGEALCAQVGGDLWFPGPGEAGVAAAAKAVCAACPVRAPCLEHALQTRELHGIWGGLDYRERRAEQRRRARAAGTLTGAPREHAASPGGSIGLGVGAGPRHRRCGSCGYLLAAPGHAIQCGARKAGAA